MVKNSAKKCTFVFSLFYNLLLIKFILCDFSVLGVAAITAQQRQEIQRLKSELAEALDNDNEDVASKGVIVQPSWTQDTEKSTQRESSKVQVNDQNRDETAALRDEIMKAVAKDNYATDGLAKISEIKALEAAFSNKEKGKDALLTVLGMQSKSTAIEEEQVGAGSVNNDDEDDDVNLKAPNVIIANIGDDSEIDIRKLQRLEVSKRRTREVLVLKYIEEDFSFVFGAEVNEWKHIVHAGQEYFIGRRVTDLLIVRKETNLYENVMVLDVGQVINFMETYTYWNLEQQQLEGIILIAIGDKVLWYRANTETKRIELYWDWMVGDTIKGLTYFNLDSKDYLTISTNQSFLVGHNALNIYQYKLETKELWIAQRLQLQYPCQEVTFLNSGRDVILAVPQNNTAAIYTFNPHEAAFSHIRFELKRTVAAEGILTIAGFQMGGRSYLALTGYQPQILLYQQGDFISKTLLGNNFGLVELFFPIPVRTYRDDLILLVQHRVDFSTHTLTVVETLIWDGEAFETSMPVPCHLGEHVVYGVGCMLDLQRDEGLKGAALLKTGDDISLIVPRNKAESGLFRFHTELLAKNSELLDLQEIFDFLKDWVREQDDFMAQAQTFLQIPNEELVKYQPDITGLETLKTPEFVFYGAVGEIYVNDYKWTLEDSNIDLELLIQSIEDLEKSLNSGRQRRNLDNVLHNELEFDEVIVDELELESQNGQKFFIQNGELNFEGLVKFSELEHLEKLINFPKRQINDEDFVLEGDLEFDHINGINWSVLRDNFVFKTEKLNLEQLEVKEEIFVENALTINTLNNLSFPDDYMLSSGPPISIIKAEKHFTNTLSASSIDTNGLINGKIPEDAITLTDAQQWLGMPTFKHLEVAEVLELHGQVHGRDKDIFPKNPSLQETNIINATCHFNQLIVNGSLVLKGEMDNQPLGPLLKDILPRSQDPTDEILVPSSKSFGLVTFPMDFHLQNKSINQIPVNDFVTIHTEQTLNITSLEGNVYFYNLTLNGSYDGVKIKDMLEEVILLEKPLDLSTTELIFPGELKASSISIFETVNDQPIKDNLQTLQEDLNIISVEFENLQAQQADFSQDILGHGKLNNVELHSIVNERSWHEPSVRGNIFLNELILEQGVQTDELHGIRTEFLLDFLNEIEELPDMVLNGQIQVDHITVTGDVQIHKLNGLLFDDDIQLTTIKLNRPNFLSTILTFKNRVNIKGQLNVVGDFRGKYLPDIIDDIVVRSTNSCIDIKAPKSFLMPIEVLQNTQVKALNGIPITNMAWKSKENNFKGSVLLKGNLVVRDIHLKGNINNLNWQDLQDLWYFDEKLQSFVLKNTIEFKTSLFLEDLTVLGDLNDVPNLSNFFENLIYKNEICLLKGKNTFTGRVSIDQGAFIKNLNGQDLTYLFNNLVFVHGPQPIVIQAPVTFEGVVRADEIKVKQFLNLEYLNGCSIKEWLNDSLRVDQDQNISHLLQFAAGSIDGNSLSVQFINDKDLSHIITLNTPQTFNETVKFSDVFLNGFILAKGWVNNLDLEKEFSTTFMNCGHQHMSTPLNIQSVVVLGNLDVQCLVNGNKNLQDVANLQEDLILESPLYFASIYSHQIIMRDSVTGIDFNKWFESAVKYNYPNNQYITGNWSSKYLTVKTGPKDFQYAINGYEPWQYYSYIRFPRSNKLEVYEDKEICLLLKQIWEAIAKKSVNIKYIEEDFNMDFGTQMESSNETLNKVFYLKSDREHFLLLNHKCKSSLYKWLSEENKFIFEISFESGPIDEIYLIPAFNKTSKLEFITNFTTREKIKCSLKPVNKWRVENNSIVLNDESFVASDLVYKTQGNNTSLWTLNNETINELDLDNKIKHKWELPAENNNNSRYRFVPFKEEQEILLTNGEHLILLSNHFEKKSIGYSNLTEPQLLRTSYFENLKNSNSESLLRPNASLTYAFSFADFKHVIERILIDLGQRLNQQVNITQLSIPETDLFDEHLVPDFLATMEELQKQNIYPPEVFNISFENITLPENPAQVLAARVVQITWPVVIEIEEIHTFLRANEKHDHPLCSSITKSLGFLIKDALMLADKRNIAKDKDYNLKINSIIERIETFHKELDKFVQALENHKDIQSEVRNVKMVQLEQFPTNQELKMFSENQHDLLFLKNFNLPGYKQGEILSLLVGSTTNPRRLWAVTNTKATIVANNNPGIFVYLEGVRGQLYQVISAIQPRSLQQLRIKQETFLLYIQDCCQVEILRYRGSQGFVKFAEIHSKEHIKQILTITLPSDSGKLKHFVILLFEKNIKFYEFVVEGLDFAPTSAFPHSALNCS